MKYLYGFIIKSDKKYLICRPFFNSRRKKYWSFPKGYSNNKENSIESAFRETLEETNIDLKKQKGKISKLGTFAYPNKKKKITLFLFEGDESLKSIKLSCTSLIKNGKYKGKPEIDMYEWVSLDKAKKKLHPSVMTALNMLKD